MALTPIANYGFQAIDPNTGAPPTGLMGSENALLAGYGAGLENLDQYGQQAVNELRQAGQQGQGFYEQGIQGFNPFAQQGTGASGIQAALSGAMGVDAQRQALANLQPVNEFLQSEGERGVIRNAAALGGLGGGNVMKELSRFNQGLAGQSAQQQFQNLGTVADRGFGAVQNIGTMRAGQADYSAQLGRDIASSLQRTGENIANMYGTAASTVGAGRSAAGQNIASAVGSTTSALADLINNQGLNQANTIGTNATNIANLLSGTGANQATTQTNLAALLANLASGSAGQYAGLPGIPGIQQTTGILQSIGQAAQGVGTMMAAGSDRRLKENIVKVGDTAGGLGLYKWNWNEEGLRLFPGQPAFGVMADEVAEKMPDALAGTKEGYQMVNYARVH